MIIIVGELNKSLPPEFRSAHGAGGRVVNLCALANVGVPTRGETRAE